MKKIIIYGVLVLLLFVLGIYVRTARLPQALPDVETTHQMTQNSIIAPAIVDSLNDITRVPSLQAGLVTAFYVKVGDKVKKGQALFSLDSALAENNLHIQKVTLEQARNNLQIEQIAFAHAKQQWARLQRIDRRAISQAELAEKSHELKMLELKVTQEKQNVELALSKFKNAELMLQQYTAHAPKDGVVLQVNAHVNEFVGSAQPIIFLGDATNIMVRVSLDERDARLFNPHAKAFLTRNDSSEEIPLTFVQLDQYIVTQERLNSRVQEVLYSFNRQKHPDYIAGQQADANITVRPSA